MQRLYETHKLLTYPRTDSRYLTTDMVGTLKERLKACAAGPYRKTASKLSMQEIHGDNLFVNNAKVSDHHAIIPTEQFVQLEKLSNDERKIYDMVVRRFLAVLSPACEYEEITLSGMIGNETFRAKTQAVINPGWRNVYEDSWQDINEDDYDSDDDFTSSAVSSGAVSAGNTLTAETLPDVKEGALLPVHALTLTEGKTKPPAYFTEGTLIAAMENPVKYMKHRDKTLVKTLGETGGLGTVATRADIIEKLFGSFLMGEKGQ